ncbi:MULTISPECIES: type II secretion system minor pseudopilin GspK [unclassified Motilimonas]|uniref:type II secretion system minor pseudopilin GspK n=1 Tax=Motilimonas TaxID=1914248 RepID=UPI001E5C8E07|nr:MULTISPECIES: type II secretion system minor pseudopilin GspK [unclassified Motilimonas]MCE0557372.1 type II secretion system minor pseudopilin GspK [Motilimonas sp. E26]MDO6527360.1 type II secretion system minor pseudopilin GspK [Motilimonas sp. 1_MG-2023]
MKGLTQNTPSAQQGVALLTVLLILSVMVVVATNMTSRLQLELMRTQGQVMSQRAYWYGHAAEALVKMTLKNALKDDEVVSLDQAWAMSGMSFPLDGGTISGEIKDRQGCFNLNALDVPNKPDGQRPLVANQFQALLEIVGVDGYYAEQITDSTRDWLDADDIAISSQGAEDSFYQGRGVPHLTANAPMVDVSEFRAIQGVSAGVYKKLKPYLCVVPDKSWLLNVNTVPADQPQIFQALFTPMLSEDQAQGLLDERPQNGWANKEEFLASSSLAGLNISDEVKAQIDVKSQYFELEGIAEFDETKVALQALFQASKKEVKTLRRQYGGVQ